MKCPFDGQARRKREHQREHEQAGDIERRAAVVEMPGGQPDRPVPEVERVADQPDELTEGIRQEPSVRRDGKNDADPATGRTPTAVCGNTQIEMIGSATAMRARPSRGRCRRQTAVTESRAPNASAPARNSHSLSGMK